MMNNMVKKDLTQDIGSRMSGNFAVSYTHLRCV